jgi:single-strand DNA-binding protein
MADSTVTIVGNLTRDPEIRFTNAGRAVATFGVAVNRRYQVNGEWQEQVSFFNVTGWGQIGENAASSLTKGARVIVFGRLEQREYETNAGEKRSVVEIVADEIGPSLRWATATVERTARTGEGGGQEVPAATGSHPPRRPSQRGLLHQRRRAVLSALRRPPFHTENTHDKDTSPMAQKKAARTRGPKDANKKFKKKTSVLVQEKVDYIDYKDVNLLQRFVSDRSKIRSRRVSGNSTQQQREVATAIKNAREMGLMAYSKRVSTTRTNRAPRDDDRGSAWRARAPS